MKTILAIVFCMLAVGTASELRERTRTTTLEDAFVAVIGSDEGLFA